MIEIQRISTANQQYYEFMEQLLVTSFPVEEYRELNVLQDYTDNQMIFHNNIILNDDIPIGFVTYWEFDEFYYIEHFAIDPNQRNGGYGQKLLTHLKEIMEKPIVLEVEHPTEEMSQRRINFYKRQGFQLWENNYFQPPYKEGYNNLPMFLMVAGELDKNRDYDRVKNKIHQVVYNYRKYQ